MAKFYDIDPKTCSKEELEQAIDFCANREEYFHTMEQSCKIYINSMYGAMGSSFYSCANKDIAESITLQGQNLIKFSVNCINDYFNNVWPYSPDAQRRVGEYIKERHPEFDVDRFVENASKMIPNEKTYQAYGDTDSCYMTIQPLMDLYGMEHKYGTDFILGMYEKVFEDYLDMCFTRYAEAFNCPKNKQVLELEKTARSLVMLAKKNYFMDISWVDSGAYIEPLHKINIKGFDVVKGSTPTFCRVAMKGFIKDILTKLNTGERPSYDYIVSLIRDIKQKFVMQSPNDICKSSNISDLEKFIKNDRYDGIHDTGVEYNKDPKHTDKNITCPIHVRAAANYNYTLSSKGRKYLSKYNFVHSKDKVKFYYCKPDSTSEENPVFAFFPNEFPVEFAPEIDFDTQFEKMILSPLNRIVVALGYQEVPSTFTYAPKLW